MSASHSVDVSDIHMEEGEEGGPAPTAGAGVGAGTAAAAPAAAKARLMMTKVELDGFKSYGEKVVVGPFHKCFTAVVGPNGSGKSNVIDALQFVFGRRASKLRLQKVGQLVHSSEKYPNLKEAKVCVYFTDIVDTADGGFEPVPGTEFVVSRIARKNNTSDYQINHKRSTWTGVTDLLRKRGIDLDMNRFLILQGEVEQIAMMKPKAATAHEMGFLEYLEDVIGSNKYVEPLEKSAAELEEIGAERLRALNRTRLVEKEKDQLEVAKLEAEAYMSKEREIATKQAHVAQVTRFQAAAALQDRQLKRNACAEKHESNDAKMQQIGADMEAVEVQYQKASKEGQVIKEQLEHTKAEYTAFERKDIKFQEDMKYAKTQGKKFQTAIKREQKKAAKLQKELESTEASLPALEAAVVTAEKAKAVQEAAVESILGEIQGKTAGLRAAMAEKQEELHPWSVKLNEAKAVLDGSSTELSLFEDKVHGAANELKQVQSELEATSASLEAAQLSLSTAEQAHTDKSSRLASARMELGAFTEEEAALAAKVRELRGTVEDGKQSLAAASSQGATLKALMQAARPGKELASAGLCGRLGDLGTIPKQYDVAVSTACGALDFLVVDTAEGAQACVEFLRKYNLGRAKFVVLDKVEWIRKDMERAYRSPSSTCRRLFDLINVSDDKYRTAFFLGLRNTLVAKNLEEATAVAYPKGSAKCMERVVTLTGELIDKSGTMSGGGGRVRSGGMKSKAAPVAGITQADIDEAFAGLRTAQKELGIARSEVSRLTGEVKRLEKDIPALEVAIKKLKLQIHSDEQNMVSLQEREQDLSRRVNPSKADLARIQKLKQTVQGATASYSKLKKVTDKLEAEVEDLQEQIRAIGGKRLASQKKAAEAAAARMEEASRTVTKARVSLKTGAKNIEKAQQAAAKAEADFEKSQATLEQLHEECKKIEEDAFKVNQAYMESQKLQKHKQAEVNALHAEHEQLKKRFEKVQKQHLDLTQELEDHDNALSEYKAHMAGCDKEIARLQGSYESFLPVIHKAVAAKKEAQGSTDEASGAEEKQEAVGAEEEQQDEAMDGEQEDREEDEVTPASSDPSSVPRTLQMLSESQLAGAKKDKLKHAITMLEAERDELRNNVNMGAIEEYRAKEAEWAERVAELDEISGRRDKCRQGYEGLRKQRLDEFMAGFSIISRKLKEMYQMITLGGDAELELVERLDPFSEGVVFSVRPPNKSWKNICNLSGGEKTLSSLALVFALHHYKPTPLYVMDEIDAALDFKNVSIVAHYIKERTKNAQFMIISLRNNMFELADRLVGIYKTSDVTKSVTINPHTFVVPPAVAAAAAKRMGRTGPSSQQPLGDRTNQA